VSKLAALVLAGLSLRCVSTRLPYRRAGLQFETGPEWGLGFVLVPASDLDEGDIELLLGDPNIDVSLGIEGKAFLPVADMAALEDLIAGNPDVFAERPADQAGGGGDDAGGGQTAGNDAGQPAAGDTPPAAAPAAAAPPAAKKPPAKKPAKAKAPTE
jgi:hypothetical protein